MHNYIHLIEVKDCRFFVSLILPSLGVILSTEDVKRLLDNQMLAVKKAAARERGREEKCAWLDRLQSTV